MNLNIRTVVSLNVFLKIVRDDKSKNYLWASVFFFLSLSNVGFILYAISLNNNVGSIKNKYEDISNKLDSTKSRLSTAEEKLYQYNKGIIHNLLVIKHDEPISACFGHALFLFNGDSKNSNFGKLRLGGKDFGIAHEPGYIIYEAKPGDFNFFIAHNTEYRINYLVFIDDEIDKRYKHLKVQILKN